MSSPSTGPTLGERIRDLRMRRGLGQDEVMHRMRNLGIDVSSSYLWHIERGLYGALNPRPEVLVGLATVLGATEAELPEVAVARIRVALDADDLEAARDSLRAALRARKRLADPGDPSRGAA